MGTGAIRRNEPWSWQDILRDCGYDEDKALSVLSTKIGYGQFDDFKKLANRKEPAMRCLVCGGIEGECND